MVEVKNSLIHGKGVFATQNISKGTYLTCDVILFLNGEIDKESELRKYVFPFRLKINCICAGFGSFFNHSSEPNVKIKAIDFVNRTKTFEIINNVIHGDELFLNYGYQPDFKNM